jgi:hypothetical protein
MTARTRLADLMAQASPHLPLALSAALQAEHMAVCQEVDAYRGALGYAVPGDHDGKLSDGSTPRCGICDALERKP